MIDDPIQPQGPRIPRDAFEENLYREYIQSVLSKWEGTLEQRIRNNLITQLQEMG